MQFRMQNFLTRSQPPVSRSGRMRIRVPGLVFMSAMAPDVITALKLPSAGHSVPFLASSLRRGPSPALNSAAESASIPPSIHVMQTKIKEQLRTEEALVQPAYGDPHYVRIDVVSSTFEGKSRRERHKLVFKSIWKEIESGLHSVDQMRTRTPAEANAERA